MLRSCIDVHFAVVILTPSTPDLDSDYSRCKDMYDL
jgi:hypothetical protein